MEMNWYNIGINPFMARTFSMPYPADAQGLLEQSTVPAGTRVRRMPGMSG
jgi:hypothetical protein